MRPPYITDQFLSEFIRAAFAEDVGDGDHSSLASIPENTKSRAQLLVKDNGVLAGMEVAEKIFHYWDRSLEFHKKSEDGAAVKKGDVAFTIAGSARSILTTERLVLNTMQRMSGIATATSKLKQLIAGTRAQLLDTRKTTPNFRLLEKWAVLIGGGKNHRIGLFDMIMLKDNHIDMAGGIMSAVNRTKDYLRATNRKLKIEVETRTLDEVEEALQVGGVDIIMLDNMPPEKLKEAVKLIAGKCQTEASGGITEETIREVALSGVDFISVGALTHTIRSLDLSLKAF